MGKMQTRVGSGKSRITPLSDSRFALEKCSEQIPTYDLNFSRGGSSHGGFSLPDKLIGVIVLVRTARRSQKVVNVRGF